MSAVLDVGGAMGFEVAKGAAESLGGSGALLFACGACAFAATAVLIILAISALDGGSKALDRVERSLGGGEDL